MSTELEASLIFTVPYLVPVSSNHYKRPCKYIGKDGCLHLGFKVTKQAQAYFDAVAIFARGETLIPESEAERKRVRYDVQIDVYLGVKMRGDADNFLKVGIDSLVRAGIINTDAAVREAKAIVHKDQRSNPRTIYQIRRINGQS